MTLERSGLFGTALGELVPAMVPESEGGGGSPPPPLVTDGYFLPPAYKRYPNPTPELGLLRMLLWDWVGRDITIGGVEYRAAHWNGPLSDAEVAAITAAGLGARIQYVDREVGPGGLHSIDGS